MFMWDKAIAVESSSNFTIMFTYTYEDPRKTLHSRLLQSIPYIQGLPHRVYLEHYTLALYYTKVYSVYLVAPAVDE